MDGCFFLDRGLELHHHHGEAIDIDDRVRTAGGGGALDGHLVDDPDDVFVVFVCV